MIGGIGNGIQWIAVMTALQEQTARDYQARISGLMESLGAAMPGVGFLLGGAIVALTSPRAAYAVAGGGLLLIVLAALPLRARLERSTLGPRRTAEPLATDRSRARPSPPAPPRALSRSQDRPSRKVESRGSWAARARDPYRRRAMPPRALAASLAVALVPLGAGCGVGGGGDRDDVRAVVVELPRTPRRTATGGRPARTTPPELRLRPTPRRRPQAGI